MPDAKFEITGAKSSYLAYTQQRSTIWPVFSKKLPCTQDAMISATTKLVAIWRRRLHELQPHGWNALDGPARLQFARNCPPEAVWTADVGTLQYCSRDYVCPWCWMRKVGRLFNTIKDFLPEKNKAKIPLQFVEIKNSVDIRDTAVAPPVALLHPVRLSAEWQFSQAVAQEIVKTLKPIGGHYNFVVAPQITKDNLINWRLSYRILMHTPLGWTMPTALQTSTRKIRYTQVRRQRDLVKIIARIMRYPVGLLKSSPNLVVKVLNARGNLKTSATIGCFRRRR